jgi:ribosomal-protein-serine acetyltransferase
LVEANRDYWAKWLSWVPNVADVDSTRLMIQQGLDALAEGSAMRFGLRYQGELVGRAFYSYIDYDLRRLEIGYQLDQAHTGRGIVTRVVRAMTTYALGEMGLNKVEILCAAGNAKSRAIPERLGFIQEGVLRQGERVNGQYHDLVIYGMLAQEWNHSKG